MDSDKNIYGLSEGVFKACQFLGLEFPSKPLDKPQPVPSDYFGNDFELNEEIKEKLRSRCKFSRERFNKVYEAFKEEFSSKKPIKQTKTDLNIYFCDYILFVKPTKKFVSEDYFHFEFYNKSFKSRNKFMWINYETIRRVLCNDSNAMSLVNNKSQTNKLFKDFIHRDWLCTQDCTFEEFKTFVEKHPRFFSKPAVSTHGKGSKIVSVEPNENINNLFEYYKKRNRIFEELITQHREIAAFCSDTVNTIRINTFLDIHNIVNILTASGRFGRSGNIVDNFHGGGMAVIIDPKTGIITSDGINGVHERVSKHPDSGKTFKGFQYPSWKKVCAAVKTMAKMIPQLRHIGWDITINDKGEPELVEANGSPGVRVQQAPDGVGRLHLYAPLMDELQNYKNEQMKLLGYRINKLLNFNSYYDMPLRKDSILKNAMENLISDCTRILDLGCRKSKAAKSFCPKGVKYFPVDFKNYDDDEIVTCNFNEGEFPNIKADTCLCAFTAEYVEPLPQFLNKMCDAAQKQILILACPVDNKHNRKFRWKNPFLTDFTEEFLIKTIEQNNFKLNAQYPAPNNSGVILYDFRKTSLT